MQSDLKNKLVIWASTNNLRWLINFHDYVRGLLKDKVRNLETAKIKDIKGKLQKEALHDYDRIIHINTLLMMYSYLEEWLYQYWKLYVPSVDLGNNRGSLGRFRYVVEKLGVDLGSRLWKDLKDTEEIRNCLLHANGRISLLKNPKKVEDIIKKGNSGLGINKDRVVISCHYLQGFNRSICRLFDTMNKYCNKHRL